MLHVRLYNFKTALQNIKRNKLFRRFVRRKKGVFSLVILLIFAWCAIFPSSLTPYDPIKINLNQSLKPISLDHPFGTDDLGRDVFARVIYGSRISLMIGSFVILIALVFGVPIGLISAYFGGVIDDILMRIMDVILAFPGILLAIAIACILGPSLFTCIIAIGIYMIPSFARIARSAALSVKGREYIEAAKAIGEGDWAIIFRHILPNCLGPILVHSTLNFATTILWSSSLSFLGLGVPPPNPEWGTMISENRIYIIVAPHLLLAPGLVLFTVTVAFNMLGDTLRDVFDVRL